MGKIIMLGTFIALLGAGAMAHAEETTPTQPGNATEATRPVPRSDDYRRQRHHESRGEYHEAGRRDRNHLGEDHGRHDEGREHRPHR